jgi:hypothetical protein
MTDKSEEEIKNAQAPSIWKALGQWMKKHCENSNAQARLKFKAAGSNKFEVVHVPSHHDPLQVVFKPRAYTITYQRKRSSGNWTKIADTKLDELIKGRANGTFYPKFDGEKFGYTLDDATTIMTVEQMGEQLIKAALLL